MKRTLQKLEGWGYRKVKISGSCLRPLLYHPPICQTDGRTDGQTGDSIYERAKQNRALKTVDGCNFEDRHIDTFQQKSSDFGKILSAEAHAITEIFSKLKMADVVVYL